MCSIQSSLLFLYYVMFSTVHVSVGFSVHSVQHQSIASAQFYSVQCKQCSESIASVQFLKHSVYRVESVAYIDNGVHRQLGYSPRQSWPVLLFSVGNVQSSIRCQWGSQSIVFSVCSVQSQHSVQCLQCSRCVLFNGAFSVCTLISVSAAFRALAVHQESVMFRVHTLNVLCPCAILEF